MPQTLPFSPKDDISTQRKQAKDKEKWKRPEFEKPAAPEPKPEDGTLTPANSPPLPIDSSTGALELPVTTRALGDRTKLIIKKNPDSHDEHSLLITVSQGLIPTHKFVTTTNELAANKFSVPAGSKGELLVIAPYRNVGRINIINNSTQLKLSTRDDSTAEKIALSGRPVLKQVIVPEPIRTPSTITPPPPQGSSMLGGGIGGLLGIAGGVLATMFMGPLGILVGLVTAVVGFFVGGSVQKSMSGQPAVPTNPPVQQIRRKPRPHYLYVNAAEPAQDPESLKNAAGRFDGKDRAPVLQSADVRGLEQYIPNAPGAARPPETEQTKPAVSL